MAQIRIGANMVVVLGFNDREGDVGLVVEDVISAFLGAASMDFPADIDTAIGETDFFANLGVEVPTSRHQARSDELGAYVAFALSPLVHADQLLSALSHGSITSIPQPS